ncbi:MAG: histone deacetylase family protein [Rhodospirillales bacterium]|nr:histone deacetylase family protein [Rhodospirillales bacterium]
MIVVTTDHAAHDPDAGAPLEGRRYWEVPARADALLQTVRAAGHQIVPHGDRGLDPISRLHDAGYLRFLKDGFATWRQEGGVGPALRPGAFAVRHLDRLPRSATAQAGYYLATLSAPLLAATWRAAYDAAQTALDGADLILQGERLAYALCRPPGHHACTDLAGGFCYLNNAAIAAQRLLDGGTGPVAILDFDVHHGNGTQQIFYERDDVHYVSVHGDPATLYPFYAGYADETGTGRGLGANLNLPLPPGTRDDGFVAAVRTGLDAIVSRRPTVLVVSLGFDAHEGDPTANLAASSEGFRAIGAALAQIGLPILLVQEGGYIVEKLPANLTAFLAGLGA